MSKPRLLLADDHKLMVDGLSSLLTSGFELLAAVSDGLAAVAAFEKLRPDLLLLDISLPLLNGIEVTRQIKQLDPKARILVVTMQTDKNFVEQAFKAGALGYVVKQAAVGELVNAIKTVLNGEYYVSPSIVQKTGTLPLEYASMPAELFGGSLTPRQREVLQLIAEGKSMKEIADLLQISVRTVEFHKKRIVEELGLRSTAELTRYALDNGIAGT